jgi:SAM-dependent methyltransferase
MTTSRDPGGAHVSERWARWRSDIDLGEYHQRWVKLESQGAAPHGEADLIEGYAPASVLDAGCGMGRVAIELARRGLDVEGVDLDDDLLAYARHDAPDLAWHLSDLATMQLGRTFALVAMPGNVMLYCRPDQRDAVIANLAGHLEPRGLLIAGFGLERGRDAVSLAKYDAGCDAAGLTLVDRFATWERAPYQGGDYAVSVHRNGARNS